MVRAATLMMAILLLAAGCLAGCGRAAPPGTTAENVLPARPAQPAEAGRVASAAIDIGAAEDLFYSVDHDLGASDISGLSRDFEQLRDLPTGDLDTNIAWQRQLDINQVAQALLGDWANGRVNDARAQLIKKAAAVATEVTRQVNEQFKEALTEVTEDAIRSLTCQDMLNSVTLILSPTQVGQSDADDWKGDIEEDAYQLLAGTFNPKGIAAVMNWASWYNEVTSSAAKASQAMLANPQPYLDILSTPGGRRATAVFVRYCYAPPSFGESP
jgi:hypothetical protein